MDQSIFRPIHLASCAVACSHCNLREICLPLGLTQAELEQIDGRLVSTRRKVARGEALYRAGDRFESVYAVWTGFFKTSVASTDGRGQVTGFQMGGELMMDGIGARRHEVDAVALEDSQVCVIPFEELEALSRQVPSLQQQFHRVLSQETLDSEELDVVAEKYPLCNKCWAEWKEYRVMVMNEMRLDMSMIDHRKLLKKHEKIFAGVLSLKEK